MCCGQKTEDRLQNSEVGMRKSEDRNLKSEVGMRNAEKKTESEVRSQELKHSVDHTDFRIKRAEIGRWNVKVGMRKESGNG
jgi:hypothetical protein